MTTQPWQSLKRICALFPLLLSFGCVPVNPSATPIDTAREQRAAANVVSLNRIGSTALKSGDLDTARLFYERVLALAPDDPTATLGLAQAFVEEGQTSKSIETLRLALTRLSTDEKASIEAVLGKLLVLDHRPDEAESVFRDGVGRFPKSVPLLTGLGVALDAEGHFQLAEDYYRQALLVSPDNIPARNDLSLSIALAGNPDAAVTALEALRSAVLRHGASEEDLRTIDGNIALAQAMRGDLSAAERAGARLGSDGHRNVVFYSAIAREQSNLP